jgi:GNAT superfamily N-acetyltransferase
MNFEIKPIAPADRPWVSTFIRQRWSGDTVVSRGKLHRPAALPGFVAAQQGQPVGLATYHLENTQAELVTLDSAAAGQGVGTALMAAVRAAAQAAGCTRLWLITTNDNLTALGFYQQQGFRLVRVHCNAVDESRRLKPEIPPIGENGLPIRDELELELALESPNPPDLAGQLAGLHAELWHNLDVLAYLQKERAAWTK